MADASPADATHAAKQKMRREMRALRRALPDQSARSDAIWERLLARDEMRAARRVMVFASVAGEPDTSPLIDRLHAAGKETALPEDLDLDPTWPDVIVVPGLAFTTDGRRLGQGGGWYDRFLVRRRPDCHTIGVGFAPQIVEDLPTGEHDVTLDAVISDRITG